MNFPPIETWIEIVILLYSLGLVSHYIYFGYLASRRLISFAKTKNAPESLLILSSPFQPFVSIVATCYNEELMISDCVRALMRLEYQKYEVILVNDGSQDQTIQILSDRYALVACEERPDSSIPTANIRAVYKSSNPIWYNLRVIDKDNGGKADALNAGICLAKGKYVMNIDADSILVPDALQKLVYPILKSEDIPVVAVGACIGISNGCTIENGTIVEKRVPRNYLPSIQVVEYARAFLLGRIGWSERNALMLISGAIGLFQRDELLAMGAYKRHSMGEDLELLVRMRRRLYDQNKPHQVVYTPDVLLWTEVPYTWKLLFRQRVRWTKGMVATLLENRTMLFNPKYGRLGLWAFPYWILFEWMAPFVELFGSIYFIVMLAMGSINWPFFFLFTTFMFLLGGVVSVTSIMFEQLAIRSYEKKTDLVRLFTRGVTELFFYHPFVTAAAIYANIQILFKRKDVWGDMKRQGYQKRQ